MTNDGRLEHADDLQRSSVLEQRLRDLGADVGSWANGPGDRYPAHEHGHDKVLVAVAGSITFLLPDSSQELELRAGDRLDLPAGTSHAAQVGDMGVRCLEGHLPAGRLGAHPRHVARWDRGDAASDAAAQVETAEPAGA